MTQDLSLVNAAVLGIIEGLTEFFPISSTGHMIIVGELLGFTGEKAETFEIFIQLGAILSVVVLYLNRFLGLLPWKIGGQGLTGLRGLWFLFVACVPVSILGLLFRSTIRDNLFSSFTVAIALIVGGVAMILLERLSLRPRVHTVDEITTKQALAIGCFQCLALWPGMSRSASTIIGGLLSGLQRQVAAEFSFLVAVPLMCAAVGWDLLKSIDHLSLSDIPLFSVGFVVSFLTAILAIRFFTSLLKRYTLSSFGYYRIVLGLAVLLLFP
jgi:undecaprenyl-diphosphatase